MPLDSKDSAPKFTPRRAAAGFGGPLPVAELSVFIEHDLVPPAERDAAIIRIADESFNSTHTDEICALRCAGALWDRIGDARRDVLAARLRRFFTSRYIRKAVEE
jgi:hypothetical protein